MSSPPPPTLTTDQQNEVKARCGYICQRVFDANCTHTADQVELAYKQSDMEYIKRDPTCPDNWFSVCNNCFGKEAASGS